MARPVMYEPQGFTLVELLPCKTRRTRRFCVRVFLLFFFLYTFFKFYFCTLSYWVISPYWVKLRETLFSIIVYSSYSCVLLIICVCFWTAIYIKGEFFFFSLPFCVLLHFKDHTYMMGNQDAERFFTMMLGCYQLVKQAKITKTQL